MIDLRGLKRGLEWGTKGLVGLIAAANASCGGRADLSLEEEFQRHEAIHGEDSPDDDDDDDPPPVIDPPFECSRDDDCGSFARCSDGACEDLLCVPGTSSCSGDTVTVCDEGGMEWWALEICARGQFCEETEGRAACVDEEENCSAGEFFCQDNSAMLCEDDGSRTLVFFCTPGTRCVTDPAPRCETIQVCEPGETVCERNLALTCDERGGGWTQAVDCGSGICREGACHPAVCTPGALTCQEGDVALCSLDGTELSVLDSCTDAEYCEPGATQCQAKVCEPHSITCLGNSVAQCDSLGADYFSVLACGDRICRDGACVERPLFHEDFESSLIDWVDAGFDYDWSVTTSTAASGTRSLQMVGGRRNH